jgi:hypothetical protein
MRHRLRNTKRQAQFPHDHGAWNCAYDNGYSRNRLRIEPTRNVASERQSNCIEDRLC